MRPFVSALLALALAAALPLAAQEGFPLDGTWRGEWGPAGGEGTMVVMVMEWDGVDVGGLINPGRSSLRFDGATLDPADWSVRIEAVSREGEPIVVEGVLEDLGSYHRRLVGTWSQDGVTHPLRMARE